MRVVAVFRQLSLYLGAEATFSSLAEIVLDEGDMEFATIMVRTLSTILLTSTELYELRLQLKDLKTEVSFCLLCILCLCVCVCVNLSDFNTVKMISVVS